MALAPTTSYQNAFFEEAGEVTRHKNFFPGSVQTVTLNTGAYTQTVGTIPATELRPYSLVKVVVTAFASDATLTLDKNYHQVGDVIEVVFTPSDIPAARTLYIKDDATSPATLATITATTDSGRTTSSRKFILGTSATWLDASVVSAPTGVITTGTVVGAVQTLSGAGAINITTLTTRLTTTGANALTLADGANGQLKIITMESDGGDGTLTPTTKTGYSTITFNDARDTVVLQFLTTLGWVIVSNNGATVA